MNRFGTRAIFGFFYLESDKSTAGAGPAGLYQLSAFITISSDTFTLEYTF